MVRATGRVANLWRVPVDGGEAEQLTSFDRGFVTTFDWSPDGDWIFVGRGQSSSDAVRIRGFR
jgi:dipeptidyl aminopeptidase/acylaminoacyl peptidase